MSLKLGILGGMFDPVHKGHMALARDAIKRLKLDQVRMIPCGEPPHRELAKCTPQQRIDMLRLACQKDVNIVVDEREINRSGKSFAFDTLESIKNDFPGAKIYFLLGADALRSLPEWYRWHDLFSLCHFIVYQRPGFSLIASETVKEEFKTRLISIDQQLQTADSGLILVCDNLNIAISSSKVRAHIEAQLPLDEMLDPAVINYINQHNLFSGTST